MFPVWRPVEYSLNTVGHQPEQKKQTNLPQLYWYTWYATVGLSEIV